MYFVQCKIVHQEGRFLNKEGLPLRIDPIRSAGQNNGFYVDVVLTATTICIFVVPFIILFIMNSLLIFWLKKWAIFRQLIHKINLCYFECKFTEKQNIWRAKETKVGEWFTDKDVSCHYCRILAGKHNAGDILMINLI